MIIITIISIIVIVLSAYCANKLFSWKICPLCAGVSGTWLWMLAGVGFGYLSLDSFQLIIAVLMGGSVVGIAYQIEKRLISFSVFLKTAFVILGFTAVYFIVQLLWVEAIAALVLTVALVIGAFAASKKPNHNSQKVEALEKEMNKCC